MLGLNAFAQNAFAAIREVGSAHVLVSTNLIQVYNNGAGVVVTIPNNAFPSTNLLSLGSGTVTFTITGAVVPTGSEILVSTGASKANVITWVPIDPDTDGVWVPIDPL
jgi:hypothetical protein